jgi:hypothetical protein
MYGPPARNTVPRVELSPTRLAEDWIAEYFGVRELAPALHGARLASPDFVALEHTVR